MTKAVHSIYIASMSIIVIVVTAYLIYTGYSYYEVPLEERFYHPRHDWFKPSGVFGHGLGILGTFLITFGVVIYILRKRYNFMSRYLKLKYLLEFHIFLCVLGPILILFHTAFKFGGLVSIAFWSMLAVVASGVIGRFIYIQIPRSIEGREFSLNEVKGMRLSLSQAISSTVGDDNDLIKTIKDGIMSDDSDGKKKSYFSKLANERKIKSTVRKMLIKKGLNHGERVKIMGMLKDEISLSHKIGRLQAMQKLFKYWHVAHLPFALIMLIVLIVHVAVTLAFGYKWIF